MLRSNLTRVVSRSRWIKISECTLSTMKIKQAQQAPQGKKRGGHPKQKQSAALSEIIKLTDKKKSVAAADVDTFLKTFPMTTLNAVEVSSLVRSLGRTKYSFEPKQLGQLTTALDSAELKWNAKCLGNMFYGLRCINQWRNPKLQLETTALLKALTSQLRTAPPAEALDPSRVSLLLFGLQNFTCDSSGSAGSLVVRELLQEITAKVSSSSPGWTGRAVGTALFGLRGASSDVPEVRALLASLLQRLDAEVADFALNPQELGNALYGLQKMSSAHREVTGVLTFVRDKLMCCDSRPFKSQEISNILYGMHNMSSSEPEVRDLINVLVDKVTQCTDEFSGQELGNSLYGLQNMSSEHGEVRELLSALSMQAQRSTRGMSPQEVSNSLYGLRNMQATHESVRGLVAVLADRVQACASPFRAHEASMAVYGLQSMSSDAAEVRAMARALSSQLDSCSDPFNAQCVGNSLYGLQNMTGDSEEVRTLLKTLNNKIRNCSDELNEQNIGNALYGFQSLSNDCPEVRELLSTVVALIERSSRVDLTSQAMGNCLYGLKGMSSASDEVLRAVEVLHLLVTRSSHPLNAKSFADALNGLKCMGSESFEVRNLLSALRDKLLHSDLGSSLEAHQIANALGGLQNMSSADSEVRELLKVLGDKCFGGQYKDLVWSQEAIGSAIYGLKNTSAHHPEVRLVLSHLADRLCLVQSPLTASQVSKVMFSLKEMTSNPAASKIIGLMDQSIRSAELDGQAVSNCLYGLQNMSCGDPQVKEFIRHLCDNIDCSTTVAMTPQGIGNAFFGLKSMTCESEEVRRLLAMLCDMGAECKLPFDAQALSTSFVGLRGCHDKHVEVADALCMLKQKLDVFKGTFTPLQLKNMFSGLRGMTSGSKDVKQVLGVLGDKLKACRGRVDGTVVGEVLYGMQRMNVEHAEVLSVLSTLSGLVPQPSSRGSAFLKKPARSNNTAVGGADFDLYSLGAALYGLASISQIHLASTQDQSFGHIMDRMKSSGVIFHLIDSILAHGVQVSSCFLLENPQSDAEYAILNDLAGMPLSHCSTLLRSLNLIELHIPQLPSTSQDSIRLIRSNIRARRGEEPVSPSTSDDELRAIYPEKSAADAAVEALRAHFASRASVKISVGDELESFDTDITIRVHAGGGGGDMQPPRYVLNLEVEGPQHAYPTKRRFSFLRDHYLKSKGCVDVVRVNYLEGDLKEAVAAAVKMVEAELNDSNL